MAAREAAREGDTVMIFPVPTCPARTPTAFMSVDRNTGFVNVGTNHDTGAFAVASIRGWWRAEGRQLYPKTRDLLITADGGGSNGSRLRLWKLELQKLADENGFGHCRLPFPAGDQQVEQDRTIGCSRSSPRIGAANPCATTRRSCN